MIEKHIRSVIRKKINNWASCVDNEEVERIIRTKTIITGGAVVSMLQNEKPKDYDVYFRDYDSAMTVAKYYSEKFNQRVMSKEVKILTTDNVGNFIEEKRDEEGNLDKDVEGLDEQLKYMADEDGKRIYMFIQSSGFAVDPDEDDPREEDEPFEDVYDTHQMQEEEIDEEERYKVRYISSNAITLSHKIQIVVRFYGEPDKIHNTYDFVHTKAYYTSWDNKLEIPKEVYEAVMNKKLTYTGSRYPIASIIRARKFIQRGWNINAGQYLKMAFQVSKLNLESIVVLRDQLIGVDSAYFNHLIVALQSKDLANVEQSYIFNIIDKIF